MSSEDISFEGTISTDEDGSEDLKEIECKLYSLVHYNDLTESDFIENLTEEYDIELSKAKEVIVSLKCDEINTENVSSEDNHDKSLSDVTDLLNDSNASKVMICTDEMLINEQDSSQQVIETKTVEKDNYGIKDIVAKEILNSEDCSEVLIDLTEDDQTVLTVTEQDSKKPDIEDSNASITEDIQLNCSDPMNIETEKEHHLIILSSDEEESTEKLSEQKVKEKPTHKKKKRIKKKKLKTKILRKDFSCPKKWTSSMVKFYSRISDKNLSFDSSKLINKMRKSSEKHVWRIRKEDLFGTKKRPRQVRCNNCRQYDHDTRHCPDPIKQIVCYMCGEVGHREIRCPHRKCLTCGRPEPIFVQSCRKCLNFGDECDLCGSLYHSSKLCPDVWRGFHLTTEPGPMVIPLNQVPRRTICSNCRKLNHFNHECHSLNNVMYVSETPLVQDYHNVAQFMNEETRNITTIIKIGLKEGMVLARQSGNNFLQEVSNKTQAGLEIDIETPDSLTVTGTLNQQKDVFSAVKTFLDRSKETSVNSKTTTKDRQQAEFNNNTNFRKIKRKQ